MLSSVTEKQKEFLDNICMTTKNPNDFYVSYELWDEYLDIMKDLCKLGYKFQSSMMGKDDTVYYCWFESKRLGHKE